MEHIKKRHNVSLIIYHLVCPAKKIFKLHPEVKEFLWGGNIWTMGDYINTVGQYGNLKMLQNYVKNQGVPNYTQLHMQETTLFTLD